MSNQNTLRMSFATLQQVLGNVQCGTPITDMEFELNSESQIVLKTTCKPFDIPADYLAKGPVETAEEVIGWLRRLSFYIHRPCLNESINMTVWRCTFDKYINKIITGLSGRPNTDILEGVTYLCTLNALYPTNYMSSLFNAIIDNPVVREHHKNSTIVYNVSTNSLHISTLSSIEVATIFKAATVALGCIGTRSIYDQVSQYSLGSFHHFFAEHSSMLLSINLKEQAMMFNLVASLFHGTNADNVFSRLGLATLECGMRCVEDSFDEQAVEEIHNFVNLYRSQVTAKIAANIE